MISRLRRRPDRAPHPGVRSRGLGQRDQRRARKMIQRVAAVIDGDLQMLQWTAAGGGARFMGLVHHTDAEREYAYDRRSQFGRLDKALDEAIAKNWTVVDMKREWKRVFAFEK